MKTKYLIAIVGLGIAFSMTAKGQFAFVEPSRKTVPAYLRTVRESVTTEPSYYNNISTRAIRNFVADYPEVSNENWFCTQDLFIAMFTLNDVNYRIDYDRKGNWIETFRTYNERSLPDDVKQSVKGSYYDYDIYLVQEIQQPFHPNVYIIHLDGKKRLINLQVCNGVIYEWQKFKKSK
jgi:hypothetical protein